MKPGAVYWDRLVLLTDQRCRQTRFHLRGSDEVKNHNKDQHRARGRGTVGSGISSGKGRVCSWVSDLSYP